MEDFIALLTGKDHQAAYRCCQDILARSAESDLYYPYFDVFVDFLNSESSYVRTRGFCLACAQVRWDTAGKPATAMPRMLLLLNDEKPTVVRQCLTALKDVLLQCPDLREIILSAACNIDLSRYKDSMTPLIQRDILRLLKQ